MAKIEQKTQVLLNNLCTIFSIPKSLTLPDPAAAARLLLAVYTMPLQRTQTQRRRYANQILAATEGHFDRWSPFVGMLGRIVITMQELPFHYTNISRSTAALVQRYQSLARIVWWIKASGLAAGAGAAGSVNAGVAEAIKTGSVRAAAKKAGARAIGFGAIPEAAAHACRKAWARAWQASSSPARQSPTIAPNVKCRKLGPCCSIVFNRDRQVTQTIVS